jgi:hypothetical protein
MDWQWGFGCGWLLFDIFRGWRRGGGADMAIQYSIQ